MQRWYSESPWRPNDAYMRHQTKPSLLQVMDRRLFGAKSLSESRLDKLYSLGTNFIEIWIRITQFSCMKMNLLMNIVKERSCMRDGFSRGQNKRDKEHARKKMLICGDICQIGKWFEEIKMLWSYFVTSSPHNSWWKTKCAAAYNLKFEKMG